MELSPPVIDSLEAKIQLIDFVYNIRETFAPLPPLYIAVYLYDASTSQNLDYSTVCLHSSYGDWLL